MIVVTGGSGKVGRACVKDLMVEWYDPTGQSTTENNPGCWREAEGGKRSVAGRWEKEDLAKAKQPGDVCNNYDAVIDINTPNP